MKQIYLSLTFTCFLFTNVSFSQADKSHISRFKNHGTQFVYEGDVYKFSDMRFIFKDDELLHYKYSLAQKNIKDAKGYGWLSVIFISVSGILMSDVVTSPQKNKYISSTYGIGAFTLTIIVPTTGITALINLKKGYKRTKALINEYNLSINENGKTSHDPSLQIGGTSHGIGLTLTF